MQMRNNLPTVTVKRAIHDIIHDESSHMASFQLLSSIFFFGIGVNNLNLIVLLLQLGGFLAALVFFVIICICQEIYSLRW